jgi:hypothetical protein
MFAAGDDTTTTEPDGERLLMVAMELVMVLFCCLYAYPHVPSRILDEGRSTVWFSIGSLDAFRSAIVNLLRQSKVIQICMAEVGASTESLSFSNLCTVDDLDKQFRLRVYDEAVPTACQQMFENIVAVFRAIDSVPDIPTREFLQRLYQRFQLMRSNFHLPSDRSDRSGLLRFCSELTVEWMQPYFAGCPLFLYPEGAKILVAQGGCSDA